MEAYYRPAVPLSATPLIPFTPLSKTPQPPFTTPFPSYLKRTHLREAGTHYWNHCCWIFDTVIKKIIIIKSSPSPLFRCRKNLATFFSLNSILQESSWLWFIYQPYVTVTLEPLYKQSHLFYHILYFIITNNATLKKKAEIYKLIWH